MSSSIDDRFPRIFPTTWLDALAAHRRTAWRPLVAEGDGDRLDSKYGGLAAIPRGESWPFCGSCGQPMQLFLQLHPRDLPREAEPFLGRRMLQLFACTTVNEVGDATCSASTHFSRASCVRSVAIAEGRHSFAPIARTPVESAHPALRIIGWEPIDDYPNWSEHEALGVRLSKGTGNLDVLSAPGDKLLGWPYWVQGPSYPFCPRCGQKMVAVFQLDHYGHLPFEFGDAGCGHVTTCRACSSFAFAYESC